MGDCMIVHEPRSGWIDEHDGASQLNFLEVTGGNFLDRFHDCGGLELVSSRV